MLKQLKQWARTLKNNLTALYYARQDPRTPWYCQWLIFITLLYALSPIDLIPDFIPVLGLLDDLLLLPLAIYLTIKLLPAAVWQESKQKALSEPLQLPKQPAALLLILACWGVLLYLAWHYWLRFYFSSANAALR